MWGIDVCTCVPEILSDDILLPEIYSDDVLFPEIYGVTSLLYLLYRKLYLMWCFCITHCTKSHFDEQVVYVMYCFLLCFL